MDYHSHQIDSAGTSAERLSEVGYVPQQIRIRDFRPSGCIENLVDHSGAHIYSSHISATSEIEGLDTRSDLRDKILSLIADRFCCCQHAALLAKNALDISDDCPLTKAVFLFQLHLRKGHVVGVVDDSDRCIVGVNIHHLRRLDNLRRSNSADWILEMLQGQAGRAHGSTQ